MNGPGFDWLNIPSSNGRNNPSANGNETYLRPSGSGNSSPIPPVSFGFGNSENSTNTHPGLQHRSQSYSSESGQIHSVQPNQTPVQVNINPGDSFSQNNTASHPASSGSYGSLAKHLQPHNYYFKNNSADELRGASIRQGFGESIGQSNSVDSLFNDQPGAHDDDYSIPLSLTAQELTLQESKTYMRWYSDILARTNSRTITMTDVFNFLNNFKIPLPVKEKIQRIFHKLLHSINIGEFFALLRLISHTLNGYDPKRKLIKVKAPVPTPPSILSKKRQNDDDNDSDSGNNGSSAGDNSSTINNNIPTDESKPLDLDSFTQFMLTGERPDDNPKKKRSKKLKSVKFSDQIVTDIHDESFINSPIGSPAPDSQLDYSLPMDQLLSKMKQQPSSSQYKSIPDEEERQVLEEMEPQMGHFRNLHAVDTASINGVPSSIDDEQYRNQFLRPNITGPQAFSPSPEPVLLKPNMTGPAQMKQYYSSDPSLRDDVSPMKPNVTGPADMARIFSPSGPMEHQTQQSQQQWQQQQAPDEQPIISLQSFTSQMTGNTLANTLQNSRVTSDGSPSRMHASSVSGRSFAPPPVPNTRRSRSVSSPTPRIPSPLSNQFQAPQPSSISFEGNLAVPYSNGNGTAPTLPPRSPLSQSFSNSPNPSFPGSPSIPGKVPPPPPPSRRRNTSFSAAPVIQQESSAPPLPPKVTSQQPPPSTNNPYSRQDYGNGGSNNPYSAVNNPPSAIYNGGDQSNNSTANILDDLKALQEEVDKIRDMTGGF